MAINKQRAGITIKQQSNYCCFSPNPLPPSDLNLKPQTQKRLSKADRLLGKLDGIGEHLPGRDTFISMYVQKEAVMSSQIEGTQASLTDILQDKKDKKEDIGEVVSYTKALNYGIQRLETLPMSLRLLREVHAQLMDQAKGQDKSPGDFRRTQNWIGPAGSTLSNATFIPPSVEIMKASLNDLEKFMHAQDELPPLVKIALIHYQFETIHPFLDGNGRLGRLLITLWLYSQDVLRNPLLYLSYYFKANRTEYYEHLTKVRTEGDFEGWIDFFLQGVIITSQESIASIHAITELKQKDTEKLTSSSLSNHTQALHVLDYLYKQPYVTSNEIIKLLQVSKPTAGKILDEFVKLGILVSDSGKIRYKQYRYDSYIQILQEGTELD